jgi:hypothetical protein
MDDYYNKYLKYKQKYLQLKTISFNYYSKKENENIFNRKLYQCPIFSTHNTFIWKKSNFLYGLLDEVALEGDELYNYIDYIIKLTKKFPVCIEIDSKIYLRVNCKYKLGHGIAVSNTFNDITDFTTYIIKKYNNEEGTKFPLIIYYDILNSEHIIPFLKKSHENFNCINNCDLSNILLKESLNKIIFRLIKNENFNELQKYYIKYTKSKGISRKIIDELNNCLTIDEICDKLKINGGYNYLYRLYPISSNQIYVSHNLINLVIKLFNYDYNTNNIYNRLPILISFNLYDLYIDNDKLLEELINKFSNFYKLN